MNAYMSLSLSSTRSPIRWALFLTHMTYGETEIERIQPIVQGYTASSDKTEIHI